MPTYAKAARMLAIIQAQDLGLLSGDKLLGVTYQRLADLLEVDHRSTILRDMRQIEDVRRLAGIYFERLKNELE